MKGRLFSTCMAGVIGVMVHCDAASAITTLTADADTFVQLGSATTNFGTSADLVVKDSGSQSFTRKAYIRFDVSGLPLDNVVAASLDLVVSGRSSGSSTQANYPVQIFGLADANAGNNWIEGNGGADNLPVGEITWNNAPANNTANNGLTAAATLLGGFTVPGTANPGDLFSFSNAALLNFLKADTDGFVTFIVRRNGGTSANNLSFASSENTAQSGPRLNLVIIPEPATASLGLMGMAGLFLRRRRMA